MSLHMRGSSFSMQCGRSFNVFIVDIAVIVIATIAVTRRETNGWKWPLFMVGYLFAAAYIMAGITYWLAVAAGL